MELREAHSRLKALTDQQPQLSPDRPVANELFVNLFNQMPTGAVIYTAVDDAQDFIITDLNQAAEDTDNVERQHVVGRKMSELFPELQAWSLVEALQQVWKSNTPKQYAPPPSREEHPFGRRDTSIFKLASGELVALYNNTHQEQLEQELLQKTTELETIVNAIPDIICLKDGDGRWLLANDYDLDLFQLEGVDYKGKTDAELAPYSKFYHDAFLACMDTDNVAWAQGEPSRAVEVIPRPDGSQKIFDVVKIPLFNPDGSRHALAVAGRDITELRRIQEKNQENENRFRLLFHNAPMPYQSLDANGNILDVNEKWLQTLGYSKKEVIGRSFNDFMAPDPAKPFNTHFNQLKQQGVLHNIEFKILKKDGSTLFAALDGEIFTNGEGQIVRTLCMFRDITRQKELDRMLRHSHTILEEQVLKRTKELREKAGEQQKTLQTLEQKSMDLHDANIALNVLLDQGRKAKQELEMKILENIKELVFPYLDELDMELIDKPDRAYVTIIRQRLKEITSSFSKELTSKLVGLTPRELQVAELVKQGRSNKDIAKLLHISLGTADVYRNNIRKKLDLQNKKINLRSYLLTHY